MKKILMLILGLLLFLNSTCRGLSPSTSTVTFPPPLVSVSVTPEFTFTPLPSFTPTNIPLPTYTPTPSWIHQGPSQATVPILMYHHVGYSPVRSKYYVTPDQFAEQMWLLHVWDYTTITTAMLAKAIREGAGLPPRIDHL